MKRVRIELEDEQGFIYVVPSLVYAREYLGISRAMMDAVCDKGVRIAGFLVRTSDAAQTNERDLPRMKGTMERRRIRQEVVAWKDGAAVRFPSVTDAARAAGCREETIRQAMRREARAGGWYWSKAEGFPWKMESWYPGMPVGFKFKSNAVIEGRPARKRDARVPDTDLERKEWERYGCHDRGQWRERLNKGIWEEFTPPLAEPTKDDYGIF